MPVTSQVAVWFPSASEKQGRCAMAQLMQRTTDTLVRVEESSFLLRGLTDGSNIHYGSCMWMTDAQVADLVVMIAQLGFGKYVVWSITTGLVTYSNTTTSVGSAGSWAQSIADATLTVTTSNSFASITDANRYVYRANAAVSGESAFSKRLLILSAAAALAVVNPGVSNLRIVGEAGTNTNVRVLTVGPSTDPGISNTDLDAIGGTPITLTADATEGSNVISAGSSIDIGWYWIRDTKGMINSSAVEYKVHRELIYISQAGTTATLSRALKRSYTTALTVKIVPVNGKLCQNIDIDFSAQTLAYGDTSVNFQLAVACVYECSISMGPVSGFRAGAVKLDLVRNDTATCTWNGNTVQQSSATGGAFGVQFNGCCGVVWNTATYLRTKPNNLNGGCIECGLINFTQDGGISDQGANGCAECDHGQESIRCFIGNMTVINWLYSRQALILSGNGDQSTGWPGHGYGCYAYGCGNVIGTIDNNGVDDAVDGSKAYLDGTYGSTLNMLSYTGMYQGNPDRLCKNLELRGVQDWLRSDNVAMSIGGNGATLGNLVIKTGAVVTFKSTDASIVGRATIFEGTGHLTVQAGAVIRFRNTHASRAIVLINSGIGWLFDWFGEAHFDADGGAPNAIQDAVATTGTHNGLNTCTLHTSNGSPVFFNSLGVFTKNGTPEVGSLEP